MAMLPASRKVSIDKLTARGGCRNDASTRLQLTRLLDKIDFRPAGLPPSAILIINRISPFSIKTSHSLHKGNNNIQSLQTSVKRTLHNIYRNAIRPQNGFIPPTAQAIVFSDRAELLACLVNELACGTAGNKWYWGSILNKYPYRDTSKTITALFADDITYLPLTLLHLHEWHMAERILTVLSVQIAEQLSIQLAEVYGLSHIVAAFNACSAVTDSTRQGDSGNSGSNAPRTDLVDASQDIAVTSRHAKVVKERDISKLLNQQATSIEEFDRVWNRLLAVGTVPSGVSPQHKMLLGLSLLLAKSPWQARREVFQRSVASAWREQARVNELTPFTENPLTGRRSDAGEDAAVQITEETGVQHALQQSPATTGADELQTKGLTSITETGNGVAAATTKQDILHEQAITTGLGGILYLLNLLESLNFPDRFAQQGHPAGNLSRWAWIELIARMLLKNQKQQFDTDPVWNLLAMLDGRKKGCIPGGSFKGSNQFRLPYGWFSSICRQCDTYRWICAGGRLLLWSSAGVLLLNIDRNDEPEYRQADDELQHYLNAASIRSSRRRQRKLLSQSSTDRVPIELHYHCEGVSDNANLVQWLQSLMTFIRRRLAFAMDGKTSPDFAALLRCRGKLYLSATHLDLVAPLDGISLAARRAGLDRDPGWCPALGKVVLFHFE